MEKTCGKNGRRCDSHYWLSSIIRADVAISGDPSKDGTIKRIFRLTGHIGPNAVDDDDDDDDDVKGISCHEYGLPSASAGVESRSGHRSSRSSDVEEMGFKVEA